jgi:hypothetical protein
VYRNHQTPEDALALQMKRIGEMLSDDLFCTKLSELMGGDPLVATLSHDWPRTRLRLLVGRLMELLESLVENVRAAGTPASRPPLGPS